MQHPVLNGLQVQDNRVLVALVGKGYCKFDAQYAPIEVGDLLTTSPTPGIVNCMLPWVHYDPDGRSFH